MEDLKRNMKLKSFDFAESTSKQLITLSTAIVAFTITFGKELFGGINNGVAFGTLIIAWVLFTISIISGIWTLMALTGSLSKTTKTIKEGDNEKQEEVSIYDKNITLPEFIQMITFVLALIATITYAVILARSETKPVPVDNMPKAEIRVIRESTFTIEDSVKVDTLGFCMPTGH